MESGFFQNTIDRPPKLATTGTGPAAGKGFAFSYTTADATSRSNLTYVHAEEAWYFKAAS
jgi:hypothetical protein